MAGIGISEVESRVHEVAYYLWGSVDPEKFEIGVSPADYGALGGEKDTKKMPLQLAAILFQIVPIPGLTDGQVALLWV